MTLAVAWGAALVNYMRFINNPSRWMLLACLPLWICVVSGPFIVAGAAFGKTRTGLTIGLAAAVLLFAWLILVQLAK